MVNVTLDFANHHHNHSNTNDTKVRPLVVPNVLGLAAGFDRDAEMVVPMLELGFGSVEVGTVTILPQTTPPTAAVTFATLRWPWSSTDHRTLLRNRYETTSGNYHFYSQGAAVVQENLQRWALQKGLQTQPQPSNGLTGSNYATKNTIPLWQRLLRPLGIAPPPPTPPGAVGVNLCLNTRTSGSSESGSEPPALLPKDVLMEEYTALIARLGPLADYLVVNLPPIAAATGNNHNNNEEWKVSEVKTLLTACLKARNALATSMNDDPDKGVTPFLPPPLFVKLYDHWTEEQLVTMAKLCLAVGMDGMVVCCHKASATATTSDLIHNHVSASSSSQQQKDDAIHIHQDRMAAIRIACIATQGHLPIIGVGGIASGHDVYDMLRAGASLVQVYSGMVYQGPGLISRLRHELAELLVLNGHNKVSDVVGLDHADIYWRQRRDKLALLQQEQAQLYLQPSPPDEE